MKECQPHQWLPVTDIPPKEFVEVNPLKSFLTQWPQIANDIRGCQLKRLIFNRFCSAAGSNPSWHLFHQLHPSRHLLPYTSSISTRDNIMPHSESDVSTFQVQFYTDSRMCTWSANMSLLLKIKTSLKWFLKRDQPSCSIKTQVC